MSRSGVRLRGTIVLQCVMPDGKSRWVDVAPNLVMNEGLREILDNGILTATQVATWFIGLANASPTPAAADTMGSHGGWTEFLGYTQSVRQSWVAVRTAVTLNNTAALASFGVTTVGTLGGAFVVGHSGKGSVTGPLLCCAANAGGNKAVTSLDTITAKYSFVAADDGV